MIWSILGTASKVLMVITLALCIIVKAHRDFAKVLQSRVVNVPYVF